MATARRIVESDNYLRAGKFEGWGPLHFLGQDITGTTLGVIGLGRIGQGLRAAWRRVWDEYSLLFQQAEYGI